MTACYKKGYPRPQFVRPLWKCLNGLWDFAFDDAGLGLSEGWMREFPEALSIRVPFTYQTQGSGIGDPGAHTNVWYHRTFLCDLRPGRRLLLHFEGADYKTTVFVNGERVGTHTGGYARFSFDITDCLFQEENDLVVLCEDSYDLSQPRGKQRWKDESFNCWYVPTTGIWKSVWLEEVPESRIEAVKMTPSIAESSVTFDFKLTIQNPDEDWSVEAVMTEAEGTFVGSVRIPAVRERISGEMKLYAEQHSNWGLRYWSPRDPYLYDIELILRKNETVIDRVGSYLGLREVRIENGQVLLNNRPIFQKLILDQGYWKETGLTPPDEDALAADIDAVLALGYNGVRKHQKIEDERFLYYCDSKGLLVWSEMAAAYEYTDDAVQEFTKEWMEIVRQQYNHPSIITWVPFNESWGFRQIRHNRTEQHFSEAIYHLTKAFDPMRPVIVNDGWEHTVSDILTLHDYEESGERFTERYTKLWEEILRGEVFHNGAYPAFANGFVYRGQPVMITEYGGIAFSGGVGWGYGNKVTDEAVFLARFEAITDAIRELPPVSGYCYTQLTDVQQEVNGLLTEERVFKIAPEKIRAINEKTKSPMANSRAV